MGVFKKIWPDVWSARMEHILNNCIMTLLENPGNTLMGVNRLLVDRDFRVRLVSNLKDPVVKAFWITEFEQWEPKFRTEAIAPIQNKVGQFLSTSIVRNIVAQVNSTLRPRDIMDSSKIFIVNLSKGRIGEDAMKLLGGMLITKMQLCAMERVDIPEIERRDFYLYIDEFQNFATESFASILSEARKYRLALIMAHQYIEQLTEEVRAAVFGNVGTIMMFRVGSPDAAFLETEFMPRFTPEDLVNLAKFEIYLRLMIDGVASEPFSAVTLPPIVQKTDSSETVIKFSRQTYARPREIVAEEIMAWSEAEGGGVEVVETKATGEVEKKFEEAEAKRKATKKFGNKPLFEYDCTRCGKHMILPVELDKSRPIYCEDCIEIVREERKSGKKRGEDHARESKKVSEAAPAVRDGSFVEKTTSEAVGLSALLPVVPNNVIGGGEAAPRKRRRRHKSGGGGGAQPSPSNQPGQPSRSSQPAKPKDEIFPW
jgi:DNA-directed RNA polymerase subunit RPC12/RpoP